MAHSRQVVTSYAEAKDNALRFRDYLVNNEALQHKLSQYAHWYFFEEKGVFAPSKFIGYKNNTYRSEAAHEGDGRETERALARFFRKVVPSDVQPDIFVNDLYARLDALLAKYGKKPKKTAVIHIRREKVRK